jgi:hypothetical protein
MRALMILGLALGVALPAWAEAAVSLRMNVSSTTVPQGEPFQLDVVLTVNGSDAVDELELPDLTDFTILRDNEAQQVSFGNRNGRRAIVVEHRRTFLLVAEDAGKHTIGIATASLGNNVARAPAITVSITPKKAAGGDDDATGATGTSPAGAAGNDATTQSDPGARFGDALPQIFLELRPDRTEAVVGEQVTVVGEIWSQVPLGSWPRIPGQKPPGFVCLALDDGLRPQAVQRQLRGQVFNVYPVTRDALFALAPGTKTLPPIEIDVVPAGSFFSRREVRVRSAPLMLTIKPLPEPAPPAFVAGAVGHVELSTTIRPAGKVTAGVPFTVVVELSGTGNIDELPLPEWSLGPNVRTFPPTVRRDRKDRDGLVAGSVVQETLVQANTPRRLTLPAISYVAYDPVEGRYVTREAPAVDVVVGPAAGAAPSTARPTQRTSIVQGARPLALGIDVRDTAGADWAPAVGGVFAVCGGVVGVVGRRRRQHASSRVGQQQRRHDDRRTQAATIRAQGDVAGAQRLLLDAVADRCGDDVRAIDTAALPAVLVSRGLSAAVAAAVAGAIVDVEAARYAPTSDKQAIGRALDLVATIDAGATP